MIIAVQYVSICLRFAVFNVHGTCGFRSLIVVAFLNVPLLWSIALFLGLRPWIRRSFAHHCIGHVQITSLLLSLLTIIEPRIAAPRLLLVSRCSKVYRLLRNFKPLLRGTWLNCTHFRIFLAVVQFLLLQQFLVLGALIIFTIVATSGSIIGNSLEFLLPSVF